MNGRMSGQERREQILELAAGEFAHAGLHGTSVETLARRADITQAYVFRLFGSKKALFLQVVRRSFDRLVDGMDRAAGERTGTDAVAAMGRFYDRALADRTALLVQLQAFAACGDEEVREVVREEMARMWAVVAGHTGLPSVATKTFIAYGMLLNTSAALAASEVNDPWARGIRTRIHAGLFDHLTPEHNR